MAVYDLVMDYCRSREVVNYHRYAPFYLAQVGAHVANLFNRGWEPEHPAFYVRGGKIQDIRMHLMAVGPPGSGKTYWIEEFLEPDWGYLSGTKIPTHFHNKITLKGLLGGYDGRGDRIKGEFERYGAGMFGFEEWETIVKTGRQEHSLDMMDQLLPVLDSGRVRYRVGDKPTIEYQTWASIMAGTQSERFSIDSGMARRLTFINMAPDMGSWKRLSDVYDDATGIAPNAKKIGEIRAGFDKIVDNFNVLGVEFNDKYKEYRNSLAPDHTIKAYLDRAAIGYHVVRNYRGQNTLNVTLDRPLQNMMLALLEMRWECLGGTSESVVLKLLAEKEWTLTDLKGTLKYYSMTYEKATKLIDSMEKSNKITMERRKIATSKKPVTFVRRLSVNEGPDWGAFLEA